MSFLKILKGGGGSEIDAITFTDNRPFAASCSRGTKRPYWRAKVALGQDSQKPYIILNGNFICLSCPSATFALQYGRLVPREQLAAKGLFCKKKKFYQRHRSGRTNHCKI